MQPLQNVCKQLFAKLMQTLRVTNSNVNVHLADGMQASYEDPWFNTILAKSVQTREHMRCSSRVCYHTARIAKKCQHKSVELRRNEFPSFHVKKCLNSLETGMADAILTLTSQKLEVKPRARR